MSPDCETQKYCRDYFFHIACYFPLVAICRFWGVVIFARDSASLTINVGEGV